MEVGRTFNESRSGKMGLNPCADSVGQDGNFSFIVSFLFNRSIPNENPVQSESVVHYYPVRTSQANQGNTFSICIYMFELFAVLTVFYQSHHGQITNSYLFEQAQTIQALKEIFQSFGKLTKF